MRWTQWLPSCSLNTHHWARHWYSKKMKGERLFDWFGVCPWDRVSLWALAGLECSVAPRLTLSLQRLPASAPWSWAHPCAPWARHWQSAQPGSGFKLRSTTLWSMLPASIKQTSIFSDNLCNFVSWGGRAFSFSRSGVLTSEQRRKGSPGLSSWWLAAWACALLAGRLACSPLGCETTHARQPFHVLVYWELKMIIIFGQL